MPSNPVDSRPEVPRPSQPPDLFLDKEGRWFHEGVEITHERTLRLFSRSLERQPDGTYHLQIGDESVPVYIEDTAFVVRSVSVQTDQEGTPTTYTLLLSDGEEESLNPETLEIGENNVMYCRVKNGYGKGPAAQTRLLSTVFFFGMRRGGPNLLAPLAGKKGMVALPETELGSVP